MYIKLPTNGHTVSMPDKRPARAPATHISLQVHGDNYPVGLFPRIYPIPGRKQDDGSVCDRNRRPRNKSTFQPSPRQ